MGPGEVGSGEGGFCFLSFLLRDVGLFLDGMSYKYQLSPSCLMSHLKLVFPYLFSFWLIFPLVKVGC